MENPSGLEDWELERDKEKKERQRNPKADLRATKGRSGAGAWQAVPLHQVSVEEDHGHDHDDMTQPR